MSQSNDRNAFFLALLISLGLGWGMVYFVQALWPRLPNWLSLILFILLAAVVIGYPIYALARWSDRYLQRQKLPRHRSSQTPDDNQ